MGRDRGRQGDKERGRVFSLMSVEVFKSFKPQLPIDEIRKISSCFDYFVPDPLSVIFKPIGLSIRVSTFPWGRLTITCEKESPLAYLDLKVEGRLRPLNVYGGVDPMINGLERWARARQVPDLSAQIYVRMTETLRSSEEGYAYETYTRTYCLSSLVTQSVSPTLLPKVLADHKPAVMPLNWKKCVMRMKESRSLDTDYQKSVAGVDRSFGHIGIVTTPKEPRKRLLRLGVV
ncbi:hypothetical protein CRG98_028902 [Punica granatum]|uniref:Uncharacterized protein n=1 Tax=Punica granatum TaxID=22663 RepID=A0A2I0J4C0_PUNGR|nr:hypothetical protein CRG98_028902 [Punica granatum]